MKRWYVVQVYAGYEDSVKSDIGRRIKEAHLEDSFGEVLIPSAKLKPLFDIEEGRDSQLFPGYVLIEMEASPEAIRLVNSSARVIKFLGGKEPVPLSKREIERVISQIKGEVAVTPQKSEFVVGSEVEIKEGPFAGFVGIVDKIEDENEKLTVMVSIFGRMTPVEIGFNQVKR
ncbi:transcription termination/antitermination protein NusG [Candidatus Dependentiae bacterium Noda2021]|nr:transcription termination/antitermination protein NusG [Candidatus Dependentiae bacterium Noda2021]